MHHLRPRAGRRRVEIRVAEAIEQRLGDLAAPRVAVADEEDTDRVAQRSLATTTGRFGRLDAHFQVTELELEPLQLLALLRDLPALPRERLRQPRIRRTALEAALGELAGFGVSRRSARTILEREQSASVYSR